MPVHLSSSTFRKAAEIQERIERLQGELDSILILRAKAEASSAQLVVAAAPAAVARRPRGKKTAGGRAPGKARGRRSTSSSGPLAPAVVQVLQSKDAPMSVAEILEGLFANGYKFASSEPKKNLFARIYRLKGVKQIGPGRFAAE
jgi:hypothetical protein